MFLIGAVVVNAIDIHGGGDYSKYLLTLIVGAILGAVAQMTFRKVLPGEFFKDDFKRRRSLLTVGYYLDNYAVPELEHRNQHKNSGCIVRAL